MGRRVLAFFLGMIFGIILLVGGLAGAIYIAVCVVPVDKMYAESDNYIGDLAKLSAYDIWQEVYRLYGEKAGIADEKGNYYTLEQFFAQYNININAVLGMELPAEVLEIPAFEFFTDGGVDRAMKQIKVSSIPAIINMFGGTNEDGTSNGMFGNTVIEELSKFSLSDLFSEEVGIAGVFANVKLSDVLTTAFPSEDTDNKLMWAVGQTTIGGVLNSVSGSDNILLQLKAGNAFEAIGALEISAVLGENQYINAILGSDATVADLIGDDGNVKLDEIIDGIAIGELLGCQKNEITDLDEYVADHQYDPEAEALIKFKGHGENIEFIKSTNKGVNWYEAELDCNNDSDDHEHTADCYAYVWYSTSVCTNKDADHVHANSDDLLKDGEYYPRVTGLYAVLSALSVADLTSGNDNALMDKIKVLKVSDIISGVEVSGVMSALVDLTIEDLMSGAIDDLYLGEFFNFTRSKVLAEDYDESTAVKIYKKSDADVLAFTVMTNADGSQVALSTNGNDWYKGEIDCNETDEEHVHNIDCYRFIWLDSDNNVAEGIQAKLASKQISDLQNLNDEVKNLTLNDVFGEDIPTVLRPIAHTKISGLQDAVDQLCLGELLGYTYEIDCKDPEHGDEHTHDCYIWTDEDGNIVDGMMAKLAYKQVSQLSDLQNTIKTFTLKDVLGEDGIPDMLKSLADKEISELNDAIKTMHLGDFLEYEKRYSCANKDDENHAHDENCAYAWYQLNCHNTEPDHEHNDDCYVVVEGMMAKLADKTVNELKKMDDIVQDFTLRDVLGDNIPAMLVDVADTKVGDLDSAIEKMYLGSAMGYHRKEISAAQVSTANSILTIGSVDNPPCVRRKAENGIPVSPAEYYKTEDGVIWYEAVLDCNIKHSPHTVDCYKYVWYYKDTDDPVEGMMKAFVNSKLSTIDQTVDDLTIKKLGISTEGNNILKAIEDVKLTEIGSAINDMKMGTMLGYTQGDKLETTNTCDKEHEHSDLCYDYEWYEDTEKTVIVKGLNGKIANMTVAGISGGQGVTNIAKSLTIGDLIDSGMMEVDADQEYTFAVIFCSHDEDCNCSLSDYIAKKGTAALAGKTLSTKDYWISTHQNYTGDQDEHKDAWKQATLSDFMNKLLSAIN